MLAAVLADGLTIIENAAKEPHVVDIANFLNTMGAMISGAGTDVIKIRGVEKLSGGTYSLIPDQIEAGTFMIAAAATHGSVVVRNIIPKHLDSVTAKLIESGAKVEEYGDALKISTSARPGKISIKTLPYPGFPTDLQPQMLAMLSLADGTSIVSEGVWDNRFGYVDELRKMGASISVDGKVAIVEGVKKITGSPVYATDLRAGAALIIAGLSAQGITEIYNLKYIDRGYENLEKKLKSLGAQVARRADEKIIGTAGVAG
jgi:UDP-N-acetylglucosamine 1-carboxyvinyltransferase